MVWLRFNYSYSLCGSKDFPAEALEKQVQEWHFSVKDHEFSTKDWQSLTEN
jgi:hypothetical protein